MKEVTKEGHCADGRRAEASACSFSKSESVKHGSVYGFGHFVNKASFLGEELGNAPAGYFKGSRG